MLRCHWAILGALLTASSTASAGVVNLGTANSYNIFVLGNDTQAANVEGRVAVGGNADLGNGFNVGSKLTGGTTNLVVGGNYTSSNSGVTGSVVVGGDATIHNASILGNLNVNGDVKLTGNGTISGALTYGGSLSKASTSIAGGTTQGTTSPPVNFASEQTYLTKLSNDLAKVVGYTYGTGVTYQYGGLTLTGAGSSIDVFTIKGSDLANANSLTINAPAGATVVINGDGTADAMQNMGFTLSGVDKQRVLFNFSRATSLTFSGVGIQGSVLAPLAAITFNSGTIDGTLVGASLSGGGVARDYQFQGDLSPVVMPSSVPEPATLLSTITGLALAGGAAYRRRRLS